MTPENREVWNQSTSKSSLFCTLKAAIMLLSFFDCIAGYCLTNKRGARYQIILTSLFKFICEFHEGFYGASYFSGASYAAGLGEFAVGSCCLEVDCQRSSVDSAKAQCSEQPQLCLQLHNEASAALHACCSNSSTF